MNKIASISLCSLKLANHSICAILLKNVTNLVLQNCLKVFYVNVPVTLCIAVHLILNYTRKFYWNTKSIIFKLCNLLQYISSQVNTPASLQP